MEQTTDGFLLGGRLSYRQFRHGYRTGIEPVLLAAGVPARPGERVLEAGCGAGAALMCLGSRIAGLYGTGIEADPGTAALARHNWAMNRLDHLVLHQATLPDVPAGIGMFDHVFANPPWHRARASLSPVLRRDLARRMQPGLLGAWIGALTPVLRPGGTLTLILPAALYAGATSLLRDFGGITLLPFWPREGVAAKIVMLQARRGSASDSAVLPGLVLHQPGGSFTEAAEQILRGGEALVTQSMMH